MLNYELCKKLKDAGFPMGDHAICEDYCVKCGRDRSEDDCTNICKDLCSQEGIVCRRSCQPSLSELIEACGDSFENLERLYHPIGDHTDWFCNVNKSCMECAPEGWDEVKSKGETPEEAVANLLITLLKKNEERKNFKS
jgi:hypothetical protein